MKSNQIYKLFIVLVLLSLAGCGGGGGGPSDSRPSSKLFVVDSPNRAIGSQINPNPTAGTFTIDRILTGPNTGLGTPGGTPSVSNLPSIALDVPGDRMFVATQGSVLVWDNAGFADGNTARTRVITSLVPDGMTTRGVNFFNLFFDATNNRLYVAEPRGDVQVYNNARTASGSVVPSRTITPDIGTEIFSTFGVAVDTTSRDLLYLGVAPSTSSILVFNNASTISSASATPDKKLDFALGLGSMFLDSANDRLYVGQFNGPIHVFNNASTLTSGAPTPSKTLTLGSTLKYIFVDPVNDRLYAVSENQIFIVNSVSTAIDPVTATVITVQSSGSLFSAVAAKP